MKEERSVDKYSDRPKKNSCESQPARKRRSEKEDRESLVKDKLMNFWDKMIFPVKCVWLAVSARLKKARKNGTGLLKLHNDIQTCGYQDVQIMWEMLRRTESELVVDTNPKSKQRTF